MVATGNQLSLSVVVPVYNSASQIEILVCRLRAVLDPLVGTYEILLVNDGSSDGSWERIAELAETNPPVHGIDLMRNYGQHNALLAGVREARYATIVTMDDDLQHPPEEITSLLQKLEEGFDVVYGTPQQEQHGLWRNVASWLTKLVLQSAMGAETARQISAFRAFRTEIRNAFRDFHGPYVSIDVLLTWGTNRFATVRVRRDPRKEGDSNYTFRKLVTHALNMVTGFSVAPLQMVSVVGFLFTALGMCVLIYVIGRFLIQGGSVPGFPFLASIIALFSGAQLFALGIIGEYLARMHFRMMERPTYAIRSSTAKSLEKDDRRY